MGGIGKMTMCKTLCNELWEFEEKVCHVELGANQSTKELLKEVLRKLTSTSEEVLHRLDEGECRYILSESVSWKQETFLAVDNVWDDTESIQQAKMFLEAAFHEGSVVMVTARSQRTLALLGIGDSQCFEVPELEEVDARNLFLYYAAKGKQFASEEDNHAIKECVARCYFRKGENQDSHYLPLALKALGVQLSCLGSKPSIWKTSLPEVREFNYFGEEMNPVFSILRVNVDRLRPQVQALFMDIALYWLQFISDGDLIGWLSLVHRQKLEDTESQLQRLKEKDLLEDVDLRSPEIFSMHDLYREIAEMEAQGKLNSANLKSRRWVYCEDSYPSDLEMTPSGGVWENLIRVGIEQNFEAADAISSLQGIQWRYCSNVVVLTLVGLRKMKGVLNLKGLKCLRSLVLMHLIELDGLEGLEDLNSLTYFQWISSPRLYHGNIARSHLGQLPASLKVLQVYDIGFDLRRDLFAPTCAS